MQHSVSLIDEHRPGGRLCKPGQTRHRRRTVVTVSKHRRVDHGAQTATREQGHASRDKLTIMLPHLPDAQRALALGDPSGRPTRRF